MRVYYLRLQRDNFAQQGSTNTWRSSVIDLYNNSYYKNFSTVKSAYGLSDGSSGSFLWVGMQRLSSSSFSSVFGGLVSFTWQDLINETWALEEEVVTDAGLITAGRFIDYSGRIDLVSFSIDAQYPSFSSLNVYTTVKATDLVPSEATLSLGIPPTDNIDITNSDRFATFELNFSQDPGDFTAFIRVEIDEPVIDPFFSSTRKLVDKFPRWMAIREFVNTDIATPALATPLSVGGSVINAIAGEWLQEADKALTFFTSQRYVDSVDLNQPAWVWKSSLVPQFIYSVVGDNSHTLSQAVDLRELYQATSEEHVFWWDENNQTIYCNQKYTSLVINGTVFAQSPHHVWNPLDDFGLVVDLTRLTLESNDFFQRRILDVYKNRGGVGLEAFKLAVRRELNLWKYATPSATPDSSYPGATPEVLEISDLEQSSEFVTAEGLPTDTFVALVNRLGDLYPLTWGHFLWDKGLWDVGGPNHLGLSTLPYRYDATPVDSQYLQSGIGDGTDLYIYTPDALPGPRQLTSQLKVRGKSKSAEQHFYPVNCTFNIYGSADRKIYNNPPLTIWMTLEAESAGVVYATSFQMTATSGADVDLPSGSGRGYVSKPIFSADDSTDASFKWYVKSTGKKALQRLSAESIRSLTLHTGFWDPLTLAYTLKPLVGANNFQAWFSTNSGRVLTSNEATIPTITGVLGPDATVPNTLSRPSIIFSSLVVSFVVGTWFSEKVSFNLTMNDTPLATSVSSVTIPVPNIVWDSYLEAIPNKQYIVEVTSLNAGVGGGRTNDGTGKDVFLPASPYILLNGNSTWSANKKTLSGGTTSLTFAVRTGVLYPITSQVWSFFEAQQITSFTTLVDQNGPWRNGIAPDSGNTNYGFVTANVGRADFGVPETTDYILTWMGVDNKGDQQVVTWLDNNTILPAVTETYYLSTPVPGAITETLSGGHYTFSSFDVKAKLKPEPEPQWNPQINAGWVYENGQEYYLFAAPQTETASPPYASFVLAGVAHQGAPIVVKTNEATPKEFRQVAFYDLDASPTTRTLQNVETLPGNGTNILYTAFTDIYNVSVQDEIFNTFNPVTNVTGNVITLASPTQKGHNYVVKYILTRSFYADNNYEAPDNTQRTQLVFDATPSRYGVSNYQVTYETSILNPATPVGVNLSPLYTVFNEGFLFISHNEYSLDAVEVSVSPSKIVADGQDYLIIALKSLDQYGNPKPNQNFTLSSNFGTFDHTSLTTDADGFSVARLTSAASTNLSTGTITITGAVSTTATFSIDPLQSRQYRLLAVINADQIPADGVSKNIIYGKVEDGTFNPLSHATVAWAKGRSLYESFNHPTTTGTVIADTSGTFVVGPFTAAPAASPGYWFVKLQCSSPNIATPTGDVIFWNEYPDSTFGVENISGRPRQPLQMGIPPVTNMFSSVVAHPVSQDETAALPPATPSSVNPPSPLSPTNWMPANWYALNKIDQYRLGIWNGQGQAPHPYSKDV